MSNTREYGYASLNAKRMVPRKLILGAVVASAVVCATAAPTMAQGLGSPIFVSGQANATITVNFATAPASGSTVTCGLTLFSNDPRGPSDGNSTTATVSGSSATCLVTVNYRWRLTSTNYSAGTDTMSISYTVQGPAQSGSGLVNTIAMPTDGTTLNMNFTVNQ